MSVIAPTAAAQSSAPNGYVRGLIARFGFNAASLSLSQITKRFFRLAVLLIVARRLGPSLFGTYVLFLTVVEMAAVFSGVGYIDLLARDVAREHAWAGRLFVRLTALRLCLIPIATGILLTILWSLRYGSAVLIDTGLLLLTLVPRSLNENCQGVLRGNSKFAALLWIESIQGAVLVAAASVFLVGVHLGVRGVIYAEGIAASLGAIVALVLTANSLRGNASLAPLPLLRTAFAFNVFPLIVNVYDRADVVILSKLSGDFAVGIYGIPYRIYTMLQIAPYALMGVLLPGYSRSTWNEESRARCGRVLHALFTGALVAVLALYFIVPSATVFILGPKFRLSENALRILAWAVIPMFLNSGLNTILLAARREKIFIRTATVCTVVNVVGNLLLVPRYSFVAAAGITVLTECVLLVQNIFFVRRIIGRVPIPDLLLRTSISFAVIGLTANAFRGALPLALAGILAIVTFALMSYVFITYPSSLRGAPQERFTQ
jgi:O-antigen/teichoic acid export membrane protein